MAKGTSRVAVCVDVLEVEYPLDITGEVMPMLAGLNDRMEPDNLAIGLLPSRKGTRIVLLHFTREKTNA